MNKPEKNYFAVNRSLLHSDRWLSETFTRGQAWIDLFGLAQHTKGFFRVRGVRVELERGQLGYSQITLSRRWKWSRNKVRRYLKELENNGDIEQQNNEVTTVITVTNYNIWQGNDTTSETTNDTTNGQQKDSKRDTYNNDNHEKKEKKLNSPFKMDENDFNTFWETYPRKQKKGGARNKFLKLDKSLLPKILSTLAIQTKSPQWSNPKFIPIPTTWLNNEQWDDEVQQETFEQEMDRMKKQHGDNVAYNRLYTKYGHEKMSPLINYFDI